MEIITLILIGLSLSIDAFTLSLAYGLLNISKRKILITSLIVGMFHFIMPFLGNSLSKILGKLIDIDFKFVLIIVLVLILIETIKSLKEEKEEYNLNFINIIIFAFLVSFDSFTVGLGLNYITNNIFLGMIIFSILSFSFTYTGFILGKYLSEKTGYLAKIIGIIILMITIVYLLCK